LKALSAPLTELSAHLLPQAINGDHCFIVQVAQCVTLTELSAHLLPQAINGDHCFIVQVAQFDHLPY
jgi:hypothetical protein